MKMERETFRATVRELARERRWGEFSTGLEGAAGSFWALHATPLQCRDVIVRPSLLARLLIVLVSNSSSSSISDRRT